MESETFIRPSSEYFSPIAMADFENGDAYLPDSMKYAEGGLGDAYQKVANRLRDNGTLLKWRGDRPYLGGMDASWMFLYPFEISAERISPNGNV